MGKKLNLNKSLHHIVIDNFTKKGKVSKSFSDLIVVQVLDNVPGKWS